MASVYDVYPNELIEKTAEKLKAVKEIQAPDWALLVKTGAHKQRPPMNPEWWYLRLAAILRTVYIRGPIGVNKLRTKFGGKQRRGHKMPHFKKGSGNIIRKCFQQLEKAGLVKSVEKGQHKGRIVTAKGKSLLDKTAVEILKSKPKAEKIEIPKKAEAKAAREEIREKKKTEEPKKEEAKAVKEASEQKPAKEKSEEPKAEE